MSDLVPSIYVGPVGYALDTGVQLIPGESVIDIPAFQAVDDDSWKAQKPSDVKSETDARSAQGEGATPEAAAAAEPPVLPAPTKPDASEGGNK